MEYLTVAEARGQTGRDNAELVVSSISGYEPILITHRDKVLAEHLMLPQEF